MKLLRLELRRLVQMKSFYICTAISLLLLVLGAFIGHSMGLDTNAMDLTRTALSDSSIVTLWSVFVAIFACDDFSNHTLKNIYARGFGRSQVYFTKYFVSLVATLVIAVLEIVVALVLGACLGSFSDIIWGDLLSFLGLELLVMIAFHAVYFGISIMIGKMGFGIALNLVGPLMVVTMFQLVLTLMKSKFNLSDYWLNDIMAKLVNTEDVLCLTSKIVVRTVVMSLVYIAAFLTAGFLVNRRREV